MLKVLSHSCACVTASSVTAKYHCFTAIILYELAPLLRTGGFLCSKVIQCQMCNKFITSWLQLVCYICIWSCGMHTLVVINLEIFTHCQHYQLVENVWCHWHVFVQTLSTVYCFSQIRVHIPNSSCHLQLPPISSIIPDLVSDRWYCWSSHCGVTRAVCTTWQPEWRYYYCYYTSLTDSFPGQPGQYG